MPPPGQTAPEASGAVPRAARVFLPWEGGPLAEQAAAWLLSRAGGARPVDLSGILAVVPTRNAGRRLREMLANLADERGGAVLPPLTAPPSILARAEEGAALLGHPPAGELESLGAWIAVVQSPEAEQCRALFPVEPPARDFAWARSAARELHSLRKLLGESALDLRSVSRRLPEGHEDAARWADLARLERSWRGLLTSRMQRCDREEARAAAAREGSLPPGVTEIVLLGVPDPFPLALDALEAHLASGVPVTVVVHAPERLAGAFDEWGRPLEGHWLSEPLPLPAFSKLVEPVADTSAMAGRVAARAASVPDPAGTLAVGVFDSASAPLLESRLGQAGVEAYRPEGRPASGEGFVWLLRLMARLVEGPCGAVFGELLRSPEVDAFLSRRLSSWDGLAAREALDECRARHLADTPGELQDFLARDSAEARAAGRERRAADCESAAAALAELEALASRLSAGPLAGSLPAVLEELLSARERSGGGDRWAARVAETVAPEIMNGLAQLAALDDAGVRLAPADQLALIADAAGAVSVPQDHPPGAVELQGWLELPWEDAPLLLLAGLNDGAVPETVTGHPFLPENLRSLPSLRLKTNDARLARDLYLLRSLTEQRREGGRVEIFVPKAGPEGDPLKPSRLLLRCEDGELPGRVSHLFREIEEPGDDAAWSPGFLLVPGLPREGAPERPVERVAVTSFATYLRSPFHYWAERVERMQQFDPGKEELDAMDFGNLCHAVLERYAEDPEASGWTDATRIESCFSETLDEIALAEYGARPRLALRIQIEAARARLAAAARHEAEARIAGWVVEGAEIRLQDRFPLSIGGVTISGKIDRIERRGDEIRILDYKTGDTRSGSLRDHVAPLRGEHEPDWPPPYAVFEHLELPLGRVGKNPALRRYRFQKLQLPLYALAVSRSEPGATVRCGYFHLPKAVAETGPDDWVASPGLLEAAEACADGVVADILAGRFHLVEPRGSRYRDWLETLHHDLPGSTLDLSHLGGGDAPRGS